MSVVLLSSATQRAVPDLAAFGCWCGFWASLSWQQVVLNRLGFAVRKRAHLDVLPSTDPTSRCSPPLHRIEHKSPCWPSLRLYGKFSPRGDTKSSCSCHNQETSVGIAYETNIAGIGSKCIGLFHNLCYTRTKGWRNKRPTRGLTNTRHQVCCLEIVYIRRNTRKKVDLVRKNIGVR